jgi:NSS family neurotransmitter:Na+ symporter
VSEAGVNRETFGSRFGALMTILGAAVGLGNVWRFPYMVGKFGGAAFVLVYVVVVVVIGVPGLMAELALGRHTRRGPAGAFAAGGLPFGRQVGWFLFFIVTAATAYYSAVIGWVLYFAVGQLAIPFQSGFSAAAVLPPSTGFSLTSFLLQLACTGAVVLAVATVLLKGLRSGIEKASKIIMPSLLIVLVVLAVRSLTLPGAMKGVEWYILKFRFQDIDAKVVVAALGHAVFSLSLGGTFMVIYGSYLNKNDDVASPAIWTVVGDTGSAILAGFAIIPAVFALGLEPTSGPALIFSTLPQVFASIPAGWAFGFLFFAGLCAAGYLSDVPAFEALVAGLTDNTGITRKRAVWWVSGMVFLFSIPPSINMGIFTPWDLTFGSGMQTLGALLAVLTLGWCVNRSAALRELAHTEGGPQRVWLFYWIRFGIPTAIIAVGVWWFVTSVLGTVAAV